MSPEDLRALSEDLITVASKTLPRGALTYGVFSGDPERLKSSVITLVRRVSDGQPVAFNALALMEIDLGDRPDDVVHLGLVMVDPDQQSRGLSWILYGLTCILLLFRNQLRPLWVSNVTQVPAIVGMVSETFADVFPTPERPEERTLRHLLIARAIMREHRHVFGVGSDAGFDEDRFIITNAYTGGSDDLKKTFEEAPKHRDAIYNDFCEQSLDYARGDDVLQLGRIDLGVTRSYLRNSVPKASLVGVLMTLAFLLLQRLVLPAVYWFDSSRHWNTLRPWGARP
ncbi:MAG: hypothetical protein AAF376_12620 [Pseudomonadota bacterium]